MRFGTRSSKSKLFEAPRENYLHRYWKRTYGFVPIEPRGALCDEGHVGSETTTPVFGIVDDDESVRIALSSLIRSLGYRTALFASAEAFLTSGQIAEMDCLIVDLHMPSVSGLELSRRLAEMNNPIPIIFVSALHDELGARALNKGAVAVLGKPFSEQALVSAIQSALESLER